MLECMGTRAWACERDETQKVSERTITVRAFWADEVVEVVGRLTDTRLFTMPGGPTGPIHDMELRLAIGRDDYVIRDVFAKMYATPHLDCSDIEPAFDQLEGVSVSRGYSRAVQERLGRERGCSHLEFLARAMGTVALQGVSNANRLERQSQPEESPGGFVPGPWMQNTCHLWAEGGIIEQKLELGWKPGSISPVPALAEWQAGRVTITPPPPGA